MNYRAVIFDLFETLIHAVPTGRREDAIALIAAAGMPEETWLRSWRQTYQVAYRNPLTLEQRVAAALRVAGMKSPRPTLVEQVAGLMQARFIPELLPDVPGALAELRERGYRRGLITNMGMDERFVLEAFELPAMLDDCIVSYEVGMAKPEPGVFRLAAERLGVEPAECVFVDDLAPYLAGARKAGMVGVLIARPGCGEGWSEEENSGEWEARIESLQELLDWLPTEAARE